MTNAFTLHSSYYKVEQAQVTQFEQLNNELKQLTAYVDFCETIVRPECQLFFDFYIFLANEHVFVSHERTLNVPIYAYLNEIISRNKHLQQFKKQFTHCKKTCMVTSMYLNKTLQQIIGEILVTFNMPIERIINAIQSLESKEPKAEDSLYIQRLVLLHLKERFQQEDYFNTFIKDAVHYGKSYAFEMNQ